MRPSVSRLVTSLCLLAVWIATPVLAAAHIALEEHSYCAEHERLEERGHGEPLDKSKTLASDAARVAPDTPGDSDDHEECAFGEEFTRECVVADFPYLTDAPPPTLASLSSLPAAFHASTADLFRLAPKTSPPFAS